jgi:hypothetical protein
MKSRAEILITLMVIGLCAMTEAGAQKPAPADRAKPDSTATHPPVDAASDAVGSSRTRTPAPADPPAMGNGPVLAAPASNAEGQLKKPY